VTEEVGVHPLDPGSVPVILHDVADLAGSVASLAARLEEVFVVGVGAEVGLEWETELSREQDYSILGPFALPDHYAGAGEVYVGHFDGYQFSHPHSRVQHQPQHHLVLEVSGRVDGMEEAFDGFFVGYLGEGAASVGAFEAEEVTGLF